MQFSHFVFTIFLLVTYSLASTPEDLASSLSLTASTTLPFPTATLAPSRTDSFIVQSWALNKNKIQSHPEFLSFVADPFPSSSNSSGGSATTTSPVLRLTYPSGSFEGDGGAQFYSLFTSNSSQTMMLSYEVAFDDNFQFVKGGKLPGLRGGPNVNGCEGGNKPNGTDCWSTRLMWRTDGAGEVYAYIPTPNNICSRPDLKCNNDFGTSIGRGSFTFPTSTWNRITLIVQLNNPGHLANGNVQLYHNDVQAISETKLQLRSSSNVLAGGLFFSSFFGGNDPSWASPSEQHAYFRNFRLWASDNPSSSPGDKVSAAHRLHVHWSLCSAIACLALALIIV